MSDATTDAPEDVRMMDYFMHLEYHELVVPDRAALRRSAHGREAPRADQPDVGPRLRAAAQLRPDRAASGSGSTTSSSSRTAASSRTSRSSRRCSTTARRRPSRSPRRRSCSTTRAACSASRTSSRSRPTRCASACGSRRCGCPRASATSTRSATGRGGAPPGAIVGWSPTGEPDLPAETFLDEGVLMASQDIAIVGYAQSPSWREAELTEMQFLFPVIADAIAMAGHRPPRHRLHVRGQLRLPVGADVRVREQPRGRRRVAADLRVPRRDGRRVGDVRGVGAPAARRHRPRARVRLGQELAGQAGRDLPAADGPVHARAARRRPHVARGAAGACAARRGSHHRTRHGRGRVPATGATR